MNGNENISLNETCGLIIETDESINKETIDFDKSDNNSGSDKE